jgi:dipeptidyl aminopeptidase/acylaminoacyl peptidase
MIPRFPPRHPARVILPAIALPLLLALPPAALQAQGWDPDSILKAEAYVRPPQAIVDAVLAPRHLSFSYSNPNADQSWFLETVDDGMPSIAALSKPFHELGGEFIDFAANRDRSLTLRGSVGLRLRAVDGTVRNLEVPQGTRISNPTWSPDGKSVAFFAHTPTTTHIWIADVATGRARQLTRTPVLATQVTRFEWTKDGRNIVTVLIPEARAPMPPTPEVPAGPQVKIGDPGRNSIRTYPSLMTTPWQRALLEWHLTGQLALIRVDNRQTIPVGRPTLIRDVSPSHDGQYLRVTRTVPPFSYIVPAGNAGRVEELWDRSGNVLDTLSTVEPNTGLRATPQAPGVGGGEPESTQSRRGFTWAPDGNGLIYLEQEPAPDSAAADTAAAAQEGAQERPRSRRMDRVIRWVPPFDSASTQVLYETSTRMNSAAFSEDMKVLFASERSGQTTHQYAVFLDTPGERHTLFRWNSTRFYENPGTLVTSGALGGTGGGPAGGGGPGGAPAAAGTIRISTDGQHVFLRGTQYHKNPEEVAPVNFIDRLNIRTGEKTRIFSSDNQGVSESPVTALELEGGRFIVARESPSEVRQDYLKEGDRLTRLTNNEDYTPDLTRAHKHRVFVTRPDGFKFLVAVTLPEGYRPGTRLPAMFWFYPREYTTQESFDERLRTYNKNAFQTFNTRSMQFLVRLGYAVVEPESPIVGAEGRMNDNYVHDLRTNLSAVIDTLDARGWIDRGRLGIGGHSYGAFSTANAMVHTPFFKAGIAGDGAYNRTLTPQSFQSERRDLWTAQGTYLDMSPLLDAHNLTGALLMYHGLFDQNVGTFPINSIRMYEALESLGKTVALYMYPWEDHGPAAQETLLDLWARWTAWLDKWVMNPRPAGKEGAAK